jgi:superfamily II DNA or RNA helicase
MILEQLKSTAGEAVYLQGVDCYLTGKIKNYTFIRQSGGRFQIKAIVTSPAAYGVDISLTIVTGQLKITNYCTCPHHQEGLCEHETAVIYKFLADDYPRLPNTSIAKPARMDGLELLKQIAFDHGEPLILTYRINGLDQDIPADFKLTLSGGNSPEIVVALIESLGDLNYSAVKRDLLFNQLAGFDRLITGHLEQILTKKDAPNRTVSFSKNRDNFQFILTLMENRKLFLSQSGEPLKPGETLRPTVRLTGDESRLKFEYDLSEFDSLGYLNRELHYLIQVNQLKRIDTSGLEKLPGEITVPSGETGRFLFEMLPKLQEKIKLETSLEISSHQLSVSEPEIKLDFDYRENMIICRPEMKIDGQIYCNQDCLSQPTTGTPYNRSPLDPKQWFTVNRQPILALQKFLAQYHFTMVSDDLAVTGPGELIRFMLHGMEQTPKDWTVTTSRSFSEFKIAPVKLEPIIELNLNETIDWFGFEIYYNLGGQTYTHQELLKLIRHTSSGSKYIQTGSQIFLIEDPGKIDLLEQTFRPSPAGKEFKRDLHDLLFYRRLFHEHGVIIKGNAVYNQFEADITGANLLENHGIPDGFTGELRQYQKEGFYWLRFLDKYHFGGILADDMGLGKTIQVLTLIKSLSKTGPVLVVCPRSLIYNWAAEIDKFYPQTKYLVYHGSPEERETMRATFLEQEIVIATYDILARDIETFENIRFYSCILDEAQHIKNYQTQRAREVKKVNAGHRLVMTGTPIENGVEELWSIFDFLMPGYLETQSQFTGKYIIPFKKSGSPETLKLLKQKVAPFILRRRKEEVLAELPEKILMLQNVMMTQLQEDTYRAILEQLKKEILDSITKNGLNKSRITVLAALTKLRQVCNHPRLVLPGAGPETDSGKMEVLLELLAGAIDGGHKVVVFSQFVKMLKLVEAQLQEAAIRYEYLDGATRDRMERINRFNETPEIAVFLISLKAGGVGINLTSADMVIHVDPWWNPMVENQATDRVHRIGQRNQVMVYKLITLGTVEEKMLKLQKRKKSVFDAVIENNESPVNSLTWDDLRELFEIE